MFRPISKTAMERLAQRAGPDSGAARALADATKYDGPVNFFVMGRDIFVVEKLPKEPEPQSPKDSENQNAKT